MEDYINDQWVDAVEIGFSEKVAKKASKALPVASETILSAMDFNIDDIFTIEDGEYEQMMYQEQFMTCLSNQGI